MGQTQVNKNNTIQCLIKDIEYVNRVSKQFPQELNLNIQADLVQNQSKKNAFFNSQKVELFVRIKINENSKFMTEKQFYTIKDLIFDLGFILTKNKEDDICQICFEKKIEKLLPCGHSYCVNCIDGWFSDKDKDSCPMCRTRITKQKMLKESYCLPSDYDLIESFKEQILEQLK